MNYHENMRPFQYNNSPPVWSMNSTRLASSTMEFDSPWQEVRWLIILSSFRGLGDTNILHYSPKDLPLVLIRPVPLLLKSKLVTQSLCYSQ